MNESWILARVFQDLMRGVRASLEDAYLFIELLTAGTITAGSSGTLDDVLAPYRKRAADLKFSEASRLRQFKVGAAARLHRCVSVNAGCAKLSGAPRRRCDQV